jgi:hypothetical protein
MVWCWKFQQEGGGEDNAYPINGEEGTAMFISWGDRVPPAVRGSGWCRVLWVLYQPHRPRLLDSAASDVWGFGRKGRNRRSWVVLVGVWGTAAPGSSDVGAAAAVGSAAHQQLQQPWEQIEKGFKAGQAIAAV